jgi:hypothetical protein
MRMLPVLIAVVDCRLEDRGRSADDAAHRHEIAHACGLPCLAKYMMRPDTNCCALSDQCVSDPVDQMTACARLSQSAPKEGLSGSRLDIGL